MKTGFLLALVLLALEAGASGVNIAVASNFVAPARDIAALFAAESGRDINVVSGASGKFYAQIRQQAPFAVFLSADQARPRQLADDGLILPGSLRTYAVGRLVLYSRDGNRVTGPVSLRDSFRRLAMANPRVAPYGRAASEVIEELSLGEALDNRVVQGENVAQAFQFVRSGNAELGFVALSQVRQFDNGSGSFWRVPSELHSPILQDAVVLRGPDEALGLAFLDFLETAAAREIITRYGYQVPVID